MFKLAIISTLATSAVNALELDADADAMAELDQFSFPQPDNGGLFSGTFSSIGNIGDNDFDKRRSTRRSGPRRSVPHKRASAKERELRK